MPDKHKNYWIMARKLYRLLIVLCTLALMAAIIYAYFREEQL
jgi:hypothetical protein